MVALQDRADAKGVDQTADELRDATGIRLSSLGVYILALIAAGITGGIEIIYSVAFGGACAMVNLRSIERFTGKVLSPENLNPSVAKVVAIFSFYIRFTLFAVALYLSVEAGLIHFMALAAGLSVTTVGIFTWYATGGVKRTRETNARAY